MNLSFHPGCPESLGIIWERPDHTSLYPLALMFFVPLNCGCTLHRLLPMAPKCNIVEAFRDPSLGSGSEPGGAPLSSFSHSYWRQLPGISWADNGDCSKKSLLKMYGVSAVSPGLLPSSQSLWLHSVNRVQCSLREALVFSKVSDFSQYFAFQENS